MDWEIAYNDSTSTGPFTPVACVSAESWWDAEMALFEVTDGVLGFGFYSVRSTGSPAARIYSWIGDGQFQLVPSLDGSEGEAQPSASSSASARPTLSTNGSTET